MSPVLNPQRARLAARLRQVRAAAFPSGNAFAARAGWPQSRVSKLETGVQLPTEKDIEAWVTVTGAGPAVRSELLALLTAARIEYVNARDVQRGRGLAVRQAEQARLEHETTRLGEYQPAMVPGLVQTAAYARELFSLPGGPRSHGASETDIEAMVAARIQRQGLLYEPGRHIELVISEAALYSPPGGTATLRGQLDRLAAVAGLESLSLDILPLRAPMAALPMGGFMLHDSFVLVETLTGEQRLDEPGEVAVYREAFEALRGRSVSGDAALELIQAALDELRTGGR